MAVKRSDPFWISYSDLITSLFFIMLALFLICLVKMKIINNEAIKARNEAQAQKTEAEERAKELEKILQLDAQFRELSQSSTLKYIEDKKTFVAKDFIGIEIFQPNDDVIKPEYLPTVDKVGNDLYTLLTKLHSNNPNFSYQLVIEGNAAIEYGKLIKNLYDPDNDEMYKLSFRRALALYHRWQNVLRLDIRQYNTEIIISGSGFNGINRDNDIEDNNKRFVIQIIPKISKPDLK